MKNLSGSGKTYLFPVREKKRLISFQIAEFVRFGVAYGSAMLSKKPLTLYLHLNGSGTLQILEARHRDTDNARYVSRSSHPAIFRSRMD